MENKYMNIKSPWKGLFWLKQKNNFWSQLNEVNLVILKLHLLIFISQSMTDLYFLLWSGCCWLSPVLIMSIDSGVRPSGLKS